MSSAARPRRSPQFMGWWVVAGAFALQALNTGLFGQAFGAYFVHFQSDFGWSRTVLSASYSLTQVVGGLMGPLQGLLIDRLGARTIVRAGTVIFGAGLILLSFVHSTLAFYGAFVVVAVGSSWGGWVTINVAVAHWFNRRRTTAMGLVATGVSVGGLMVPAVAWSMNHFGWRHTALGSGVLVLTAGFALAQLVRNRPEEYGQVPDGAPAPAADPGSAPTAPRRAEGLVNFTLGQALRAPAFWFIGIGHASAVLVVAAVNVHLISHLVSRLHMSLEVASSMVAVVTVFTVLGQLGGGFLADRLERRLLAALATTGHVLGMLVLAFAASPAWVVLFAVLHGLAWGVRGPLMSAIRVDYFGRQAFGAILGSSQLLVMLGTIGGPLLAGAVADRTGDYRLGFVILGALGGVGTLFFLLARRPQPPPAAPAGIIRSP